MALSAFADKSKRPQKQALREVLGRSSITWDALIEWAAEEYQPFTEEWTCYSEKWGWSLRLKHKTRAILYMTPQAKHFLVGMVLGEKAVAVALKMKLPATVVKEIKTAKRYAEGRALRFEIRFKKDLDTITKLATAKMST
jgi:hypothetical protein